MDRRPENSDRALLTKLEIKVRSDCVGLEIVGVRLSSVGTVVWTRVSTGDVVPTWIDIYGFTEVNRNSAVMRHVDVINARISARYPGA